MKALGPFVTAGSKEEGEGRKRKGHFRAYSLQDCLELFMVTDISVLCSSFMVIVGYGLSRLLFLLLDWFPMSLWEHLFVGMCDFYRLTFSHVAFWICFWWRCINFNYCSHFCSKHSWNNCLQWPLGLFHTSLFQKGKKHGWKIAIIKLYPLVLWQVRTWFS